MKMKFTLVLCFICLLTALRAQTYTQGDVSITFVTNATHDSTFCRTSGTISYAVTVQNSFVGDSVRVADQTNPYTYWTEGNSTGQNPWTFTKQIMGNIWEYDEQVHNDTVWVGNLNPVKVISGPDTIFNIINQFPFVVTNPCEYDTISITTYMDNNQNCIYDAGDGLSRYVNFITEVYNNQYFLQSFYTFYNNTVYDPAELFANPFVQKSWFDSAKVYMSNQSYFLFPPSPCSPAVHFFTSLPAVAQFPIHCASLVDMNCFATATGPVRPLVPFILHPVVSNFGCDSVSGTLTLILDPRVTYNSGLSTNPATSVSGDTLRWNYTNLSNVSSGAYWNSFFSGVHLTPNGSVNIGDSLCFTVYTHVPVNDIDASNNSYTTCLHLVNSFDPNIKEVEPQGTGVTGDIPGTTEALTYTIHFQNTGNAAALNINIADTLSPYVDHGSIRILGASHTMTPEWKADNVVNFKFANINLPDSTSNEPASHGFVRFKIGLKPSLNTGTQIKNSASIFFDFNPAVITNTTLNTLTTPTAVTTIKVQPVSVLIYPNPSQGRFRVVTDGLQMPLEIYNTAGMRVYTGVSQTDVSLTGLASGLYLVKLTDGVHVITRKIVIE